MPGAGGTWQVVAGGMGTVTQMLVAAAMEAGAEIRTSLGVQSVEVRDGTATGDQAHGRGLGGQRVGLHAGGHCNR